MIRPAIRVVSQKSVVIGGVVTGHAFTERCVHRVCGYGGGVVKHI